MTVISRDLGMRSKTSRDEKFYDLLLKVIINYYPVKVIE